MPSTAVVSNATTERGDEPGLHSVVIGDEDGMEVIRDDFHVAANDASPSRPRRLPSR